MKFRNNKLNAVLFIYSDGYRAWLQNGLLHCIYGPAVIYPNGFRVWYQNGKRHRINGPAIIFTDGSEEWWENGEWIKR